MSYYSGTASTIFIFIFFMKILPCSKDTQNSKANETVYPIYKVYNDKLRLKLLREGDDTI